MITNVSPTNCFHILSDELNKEIALCEGSTQGNWDPWEGQQPFRPYPNVVVAAPPR